MERTEVYKIVDTERTYQNSIWGAEKHSPEEWLLYMESYLNEAKHMLARETRVVGKERIMTNIRKIAALGVAAMEQHDTPPRIDI